MMHSSADAPEAVLFNGLDLSESAPQVERGACMSLLTDRGLHYGDGLFETIACRDGEPQFLADHLQRLALGCERLGIELRSRGELLEDLQRLAAGRARSLLKVLLTRGPATARGYAPRGDERATRIVLRYGWPLEDLRWSSEGVAVRMAALTLPENPRLAGLKHLNRLEQVLARAELRGSGFEEALLLSRSGCLVSGTMSNVFVVARSKVATPRLDRCGVAGVMRRVLMRTADAAGIQVEEARITRQDLEAADEIFLTNVRIGIWPVRALGSRELGVGPRTRQLQRLIEPLRARSDAEQAGVDR